MHTLSSLLGVSSDWMLRNDGTYLLLYRISALEAKTWVLEPIQALVVCLIDGATSYGELIREVSHVIGTSRDRGKSLLDGVISTLNSSEEIIADVTTTRCRSFDTEEFFIPLSQYRIPQTARLRLPTKVGLFVTAKCCADCVYCYADRRMAKSEDVLPLSRWREIIDECLGLRIRNLDLLGGDALSSAVGRGVLKHLLHRGIQVFLSTKCEITSEIAHELVDTGFLATECSEGNTLQISIDNVDPAMADYLTGTAGFLDRCSRSVSSCLSAGIHPRVKSVLTSLNYDSIPSVVDYFRQQGVRDFQFVQYGISHFRYRDDLFLSRKHKARIHDEASLVRDAHPDLLITVQEETGPPTSVEEKEMAWRNRPRCTGGFTSVVIAPNGAMLPCEQLPQEEPFIVSNLREGSIVEAWQDERFNSFLFPDQSLFSGTPCAQCADFEDCRTSAGFCYRDAFLAYETVHEAPPSCPHQTRIGRRLL